MSNPAEIFQNTQTAFAYKSDAELRNARFLFRLFNINTIVKYGPSLATWSLEKGIPVKALIRKFGFNHFCGGETMGECDQTARKLWNYKVGSILDYSVEGIKDEASFDSNAEEIMDAIHRTAKEEMYPFAVFKTTGIAPFEVLEKSDSGEPMNQSEMHRLDAAKERFVKLCDEAASMRVRLFIDAEESWIQDTIDAWTEEMMRKHNRNEVWIFNTLQLYRHDRVIYMKKCIENARNEGFKLGFKLVRGAYMEKERERADLLGYSSPIQVDKAHADRDYNIALKLCVEHISTVSICAGTHNEESSAWLMQLMKDHQIEPGDTRCWFAQLFGMSDHISFNLASRGYNVAKYLPYGPVGAVMPYLSRRAQENTSVKGQVGRELSMISAELKRRKMG